MLRRVFLLAAVAVVLPAVWLTAASADEPAATCIPDDAVLALDISQPKPVLDLALDDKTVKTVTDLPIYNLMAMSAGFKQFKGGVAYLESTLDTDWRTASRKLFGGGATLSVHPGGGWLFIADSTDDGALLNQLHGQLVMIAKADAQNKGEPERVASVEYQGVKVWQFNPDECHAIAGKRFYMSNRRDLLKQALDMRAKPDAKNLTTTAAYQTAKKVAGPDSCGVAVANMEVLKMLGPVENLLQPSQNPMWALLFSGMTDSIRESKWLSMVLKVEGDKITLHAAGDNKPNAESLTGFAAPRAADDGAMPKFPVANQVASMSFYRDLHAFYAAKDTLFPERTSELIFFENMMGIFFTGRDLTDEVMAETKPQVRVVVAKQNYDPAVGTPKTQWPAFAAVFQLKNPQEFGEVAEEAWQKALGLINFIRGQQALSGMILDRPTHNGVQFTVARFAKPRGDDAAADETRKNFSPALAMVGEYVIFSSSQSLARDLIDACKQEMEGKVKPAPASHTLLDVDGKLLTEIIMANRENMITNNMLEKGNSRDQAAGEIDFLITLVNLMSGAKFTASSPGGRILASLELRIHQE